MPQIPFLTNTNFGTLFIYNALVITFRQTGNT